MLHPKHAVSFHHLDSLVKREHCFSKRSRALQPPFIDKFAQTGQAPPAETDVCNCIMHKFTVISYLQRPHLFSIPNRTHTCHRHTLMWKDYNIFPKMVMVISATQTGLSVGRAAAVFASGLAKAAEMIKRCSMKGQY